MYENQKEPPSLVNAGHLRSGTKSDLLKCFDKTSEKPSTDVTVKVFDGPAVVNFIQPTQSVNTIGEYVEKQLVPFAESHIFGCVSRLDWI